MSTWQDAITHAVHARGYDGRDMTQAQYALSQVAKMTEELYELAMCFELDNDASYDMREFLRAANDAAHYIFNHPERMGNPNVNIVLAAKELSDVLVTVAMSASALEIDVETFAVQKAQRDTTRGVRI